MKRLPIASTPIPESPSCRLSFSSLNWDNAGLPGRHRILIQVTSRGSKGAQMIAERLQPNAAIITDVTHDTQTPMIDVKKEGDVKIGEGPVIAYAPAVQQKLRDLIVDTAQEKKIPFQRSALSRATGTDTDAFAYSNAGVASALISLPLRYMHTTVEMVHKNDVENVIRLIYETLLKMKDGDSFSYFD